MISEISIRNRQRLRRVDAWLLRELTLVLLREHLHCSEFELGVHLVGVKEMTRISETFLQHEGSTDVITFNHAEGKHTPFLWGEIFVSVGDAVAQAKLFRTTWQEEVARYVVHGLLHLCGYDDRRPAERREMKRQENRLMAGLRRRFLLERLERSRRKYKARDC
jgi:probable rRNA maturation factor